MVDYDVTMKIYNGDTSLTATQLYSPDYMTQNAYFNIAAEADNYRVLDFLLFDLAYFQEPYTLFEATIGLLIARKKFDMLLYLVNFSQRQRRWVQFRISNLYLDSLLEKFGRLDVKLREFLLAVYRCRDLTDQIHTKLLTWEPDMVILNRYDTELMDYESYCYNQWCLGRKQHSVDSLILDHWEEFFQHCVQIDNHAQGTRTVTLTFLNMIQDNDLDLVIQYVRGHDFNPHSTFYLLHSYGVYLSACWFTELYESNSFVASSDELHAIVTWCYLYEQWHDQWNNHGHEMAITSEVRTYIETTYKKMNQVLSRVFAMRRISNWFAKEYALGGCIDKMLYAPPNGLMLRRGIKECCA